MSRGPEYPKGKEVDIDTKPFRLSVFFMVTRLEAPETEIRLFSRFLSHFTLERSRSEQYRSAEIKFDKEFMSLLDNLVLLSEELPQHLVASRIRQAIAYTSIALVTESELAKNPSISQSLRLTARRTLLHGVRHFEFINSTVDQEWINQLASDLLMQQDKEILRGKLSLFSINPPRAKVSS